MQAKSSDAFRSEDTDSSQALHFGDLIYLCIEDEGYLHVEGFADARLGCLSSRTKPSGDHDKNRHDEGLEILPRARSAGPHYFDECIFRIQPKLFYEMTSAYHKASCAEEETSQEELDLLKLKMSYELAANAAAMEASQKQPWRVAYGKAIQLQHYKSGKFLTAMTKSLADVDKGMLKVGLTDHGSTKAWFSFQPKYKNKSAGNEIRFGDFLSVTRAKHSDQFFGLGKAHYHRDTKNRLEVAIKHEPASMQIHFHSRVSEQHAKSIQLGNVYRIFHVEAEAFVMASSNPEKKQAYLKPLLPHSRPFDSMNANMKSLFILEGANRMQGGNLNRQMLCRFRHLTTRRYLCVPSSRASSVELTTSDGPETIFYLHLSDDMTSSISLNSLSRRVHHLNELDSVRIEHRVTTTTTPGTLTSIDEKSQPQMLRSVWLHHANVPKPKEKSDKPIASDMMADNLKTARARRSMEFHTACESFEKDSFRFIPASSSELKNAHLILSCRDMLELYPDRAKNVITNEGRTLTFADVNDIVDVLGEIIVFLLPHYSMDKVDSTSLQKKDIDPLTFMCEGIERDAQRQHQVRESGLLSLIYRILNLMKDMGIDLKTITGNGKHRVMLRIQRLANKAVVHICDKNFLNLSYSFRKQFVKDTMDQIGTNTGSNEVLCIMFQNNSQMLYNEVDQNLLDLCCKEVLSKGVHAPEILRFLSILCSYGGVNVPQNQELILAALFDLEMSPLVRAKDNLDGEEDENDEEEGSDDDAGVNDVSQNKIYRRERMLIETCIDPKECTPVPARVKKYAHDIASGVAGYQSNATHFPGKEILESGFPRLMISWKGSFQWSPESESSAPTDSADFNISSEKGLYYSPHKIDVISKTLPLTKDLKKYYEHQKDNQAEKETQTRRWVKLESIMWTLEPELLYPKLHSGRTWQDRLLEFSMNPQALEKFRMMESLAHYYSRQLHLFSQLLLGRNIAAMTILGGQFHYILLLAGLSNEMLPYSIRTSFSKILHRCWIDRFPHEILNLPQTVLAISTLPVPNDTSPTLVHFNLPSDHIGRKDKNAFVSYAYANKFALLQGTLNELLQQMSTKRQRGEKKEHNRFINSMLQNVQYLVASGFYSDLQSFRVLCEYVIVALDGRADLKAISAEMVQYTQPNILRRLDTKINIPLLKPDLQKKDDTMAQISASSDGYDENDQNEHKLEEEAVNQMEMQRYYKNDRNDLLMKAKMQLCRILETINAIWIQSKIVRVLSGFNHQLPVEELDDIFSDRLMDLQTYSSSPLDTICCDLLMYENPELFDQTLRFLIQRYTTRQTIMDVVQNAVLLSPGFEEDSSSKLFQAIESLKFDFGYFQSILMEHFYSDMEAEQDFHLHKIIDNLKYLGQYCGTMIQMNVQSSSAESSESQPEFKFSPNRSHQLSLQRLQIHHLILQFFLNTVFPRAFVIRNEQLQLIQEEISSFLVKFMNRNEQTQASVYPYIPQLLVMKRFQKSTGAIIVAIFIHNQELCLKVPDQIIVSVMDMIEVKSQRNANSIKSIMDFFETYVAPNGLPVKRHQNFLFQVLTSPQVKYGCNLYTTGIRSSMTISSPTLYQTVGYSELIRIVQSTDSEEDQLDVAYYLRLIKLLSILTSGKNSRTEIGCQQLLPLNLILTILLDSRIPIVIKTAHAQFLRDAYFDVNIKVDSYLATMPELWRVLIHVSTVISKYLGMVAAMNVAAKAKTSFSSSSSSSVKPQELFNYLFDGLVPMVIDFFHFVYDPHAFDLDENTTFIVEALQADFKSLKKRGKIKIQSRVRMIDLVLTSMNRRRASAVHNVQDTLNFKKSRRQSIKLSSNHSSSRGMRRLNLTLSPLEKFHHELVDAVATSTQDEFDEIIELLESIQDRTNKHDEGYVEEEKKRGNHHHLRSSDPRANTITLADVVQRLVQHIKRYPERASAISGTDVLRRLVTIKELSEDQKSSLSLIELKQAEHEYLEIQNLVGKAGAADLAVSLISGNVSEIIVSKGFHLGIELLNGGNRYIQDMMYQSLVESKAGTTFFKEVDLRIQNAMDKVKIVRWYTKMIEENRMESQSTSIASAQLSGSRSQVVLHEDPDSPSTSNIFRFCQLLAEGHNMKTQTLLLRQENVSQSYSIVHRGANYLALMAKTDRYLEELETKDCDIFIKCWDFLIEVVQGPCHANQEVLADSVMIEIFRKVLSVQFSSRIDAHLVKNIYAKAVKAVVSLVEGNSGVQIVSRLRQTIELPMLKRRLKVIYNDYLESYVKQEARGAFAAKKDSNHAEEDEYLEEGFDIMTLMKVLFPHYHSGSSSSSSSTNETTSSDPHKHHRHHHHQDVTQKAIDFFNERHCCVEIWWGRPEGHLDTIYFPMPKHCRTSFEFIENSRLRFIGDLEFGSDARFRQFVDGIQNLDDEMVHIDYLSQFKIYHVLGHYIPLIKTASYITALVMNLVMLLGLEYPHDGEYPHISNPFLRTFFYTLAGVQLIMSILIMVFMLLVRAPLVYQKRFNVLKTVMMDEYHHHQSTRGGKGKGGSGSSSSSSSRHRHHHHHHHHQVSSSSSSSPCRRVVRLWLREWWVYYHTLVKWLVVAWTLQIVFTLAYPNLAFLDVFLVITLVFVTGPFLSCTRAYLERSVLPSSFVFCCAFDVVAEKYTAYYVAYLITAAIGFIRHIMWYSFHLLDVVVKSSSLQNVFRAILRPRKALFMTTILGAFVIYFFTLVLFFFLPEDTFDPQVNQNHCDSLLRCYATTLHRGLLMGGGMGEFLTNEQGYAPSYVVAPWKFYLRIVFDLSFFVVVIVLLLNIIFGIIIDTFSELRSASNYTQNMMNNQCFICGLNRQVFENHYTRRGITNGFTKHFLEEHNMWHYLFFIVYLRNKDRTECTGVESFVLESLEADDLSWIPSGMATCLAEAWTDEKSNADELMLEFKSDLSALKMDLQRAVMSLKESSRVASGPAKGTAVAADADGPFSTVTSSSRTTTTITALEQGPPETTPGTTYLSS